MNQEHRPTVTRAIGNLFNAAIEQGSVNNPDILRRYTPSMEIQVNVAADKGTPVEGKRNTWTDEHGSEWWHIRVPKKAMTEEAYWNDYRLNWSIKQHAEGIGMTGWDWEHKRSKWVAFDFDSITGHAPGVGVDANALAQVSEKAQAIPWVQVRFSTRGGGLHLYVFFCDPADGDMAGVPTKTHTEHQALGRCVLTMMSGFVGFNFAAAIDACGGNMWVWHRDATKDNHGFGIIKDCEQRLSEDKLHPDWLDNLEVVRNTRSKTRIRYASSDTASEVEHMADSQDSVEWTVHHQAIVDKLVENKNFTTVWHPDYNLLQTHTVALKKVHEEGDFLGVFDTIALGEDPNPNCFCFPLPNRGFRVVLFSKGRQEDPLWTQDGNGWTYILFDQQPTFQQTCLSVGGAEGLDGSFSFDSLKSAVKAMTRLGLDINWDEWEDYKDRETLLGFKNHRVWIRIKWEKDEAKPKGWKYIRGGWIEKVYRGGDFTVDHNEGIDFDAFDSSIRNVKTAGKDDAGWMVYDESGQWVRHSLSHVRAVFQKRHGIPKQDVDVAVGSCVLKSWELVNLPFQPEYPGGRQWNLGAPQWRHEPANLEYDEEPNHPHWDLILDHIGRDLNIPLREDEWAIRNGITSGRRYLQYWIASLLREPFDKLPYLFLYGPENSGKSTLHWAIAKLMTAGVNNISNALGTRSEFNGELANCVLGYVEERDVAKGGDIAKNRMKDWTTSDWLPIRRMRTDIYQILNMLHFIQCSNTRWACLASAGDTRVIMLYVAAFTGQEIPKALLSKRLDDEAPHFMRTLLDIQLPPPIGRYRLPTIETTAKERFEDQMRNPLEIFLKDNVHYTPGDTIPWVDFYNKFQTALEEEGDKAYWSAKRTLLAMPDEYPVGYKPDDTNSKVVGNIAWHRPKRIDASKKLYNTKGQMLVTQE